MNQIKTIEIGRAADGRGTSSDISSSVASSGSSAPPRNDAKKNLAWVDNPAVQKLLDVIISIMAEEYIEVAKQNPTIFKDGGQE
jgi:hypothetical protein